MLPIVPTTGDTIPARAMTLPKIMETDSTGAGASTGCPTVPNATSLSPKLMRRILAKEFIDMRELLPESWRSEPQQTSGTSRTVACGPVRDFKLWTECYGTLAGVLTAAYPGKAPHLMAYLRMMARASRNYETDAWVEYDIAHRRRAGNCLSLDWGTIDPALYNETFTGRAKPIKRCSYCVADTHSLEECQYVPKGWSGQQELKPQNTQRSQGPSRGATRHESGRADSVEICRLYNEQGAGCTYPACRFAHLCMRCHRPHPQFECGRPKGGRQRPQQARSDHGGRKDSASTSRTDVWNSVVTISVTAKLYN